MKKMRMLLTTLFTASLLLAGCGTSKDAASEQSNATSESTATDVNNTDATTSSAGANSSSSNINTENEAMAEPDQKQAAPTYRLIVSFISIGEGTDPEAKNIMDGIVNKWSAEAGNSINADPIPWGREGEVDYCFNLNELSAKDQARMARDMREAFDGHPLVQISEFQPSMHNR